MLGFLSGVISADPPIEHGFKAAMMGSVGSSSNAAGGYFPP